MNDCSVRKKYVDILKAIGISLVILGHINYANDYIKTWIYSFHMPLFFFATGLTIKNEKLNASYIKRKIRSLVVPYFIWAFIYSGFSYKKCAFIMYGSYNTVMNAERLGTLWFLPT